MKNCLICDSTLKPFFSFGSMPIANGWLTPEEFAGEYFYELRVAFCPVCHMVQLMEQPARQKMFHSQYAFFSSTSVRMSQHFKQFAELVKSSYLSPQDAFVVEIGSNDGIMLQHFARPGIRHLGIEPSANVAQAGREKGIETWCRFFDKELAQEIVTQQGKADAVLAANVMCHLPYLHSVAAGINILLKPRGVLIFEDPYVGDIIEKTSYDQIYDEHAFYFSLASVSYLFGQHGLEVFDLEPQEVHGGSMRYYIGFKGEYPISPAVQEQRRKEEDLGLTRMETYERLRINIEKSRDELKKLLIDLKNQGKRVVGYAATSKSTTVINYCGITPELLEYISDTTPLKQGKYSPGAHIPVRAYEEFKAAYPDYALLFGWNHAGEIMEKEAGFTASGGKWILYVPKVQVL